MKKSTTTLIIFFTVFIIPMVLATVLFMRGKPIGQTTNLGKLVTPPVQITTLLPKFGNHKWTMMWFTSKQCNQKTCEKTLHDLNQIKKATGKHQNDIDIMLLSQKEQQTSKTFTRWLETRKVLHASISSKQLNADNIYLIDPHGFIMMRYSEHRNPHDIYKDLKKLLRLSGA